MNKHATNLRRTRADMLGTDDEDHYWECHRAAAEIERLEAKVAKLEAALEEIVINTPTGNTVTGCRRVAQAALEAK